MRPGGARNPEAPAIPVWVAAVRAAKERALGHTDGGLLRPLALAFVRS